MATRTLGVKFEVVGFKEAADSVKQLKQGINDSLKGNRENIDVAQQLDKTTASVIDNAEIISSKKYSFDGDYAGNSITTFRYLQNKQYQDAFNTFARPRLNAVSGGFFEGIGSAAGTRAFDRIDGFLRRLTGREKYAELVELGTKSIVKLATAIGYQIKFKKADITARVDLNKAINKPLVVRQNEGLLSGIVDKVMMPLKTINYSFFEGLGSFFGQQYATGLSSVLEQEQDISFYKKGQVGGKTFGYVKDEGVKEFFAQIQNIVTEYETLNSQLPNAENARSALNLFAKFFRQITKTITHLPASFVTGHRKGSVQIEGLPKVQQVLADLNDEDLPDLKGKTRALFTVGGLAAESGQSGMRMAREIAQSATDDTAVIGADNSFTDLNFSVFGNKLLWGADLLQKIASMNVKGFNPDSVKLAAQIIAILKKNPQLKEVRVTGHSAGGYVVEEVQELLDLLGYAQKVKTIATGTPETIGGLNNPNTERKIGDNDDIVKNAEKAGSYLGLTNERDKASELEKVASHYGEDYLTSESYLQAVLGEGFDKEKNEELKKKRSPFKGKLIELETLYSSYVSAIYQDIDELADELSIAPDRLIAKARREKIRNKSVDKLAAKTTAKDYKQFDLRDKTKTAVVVIGGFGGVGGKSGQSFANSLNKYTNDKTTQYFGAENPFTDRYSKEEMSAPDVGEKMNRHMIDVFYKAHQEGVNPDAIDIAAQVIDLQKQNPDLEIQVLGISSGGYIAEDVIALLQEYGGVDMSKINVLASATPELPGGIKNKKLQKILGDNDHIFNVGKLKEINQKFEELIGFPLFSELAAERQNLPNINDHEFYTYLENSPQLQDFLFGKNSNIKELLEIDDSILEKKTSAEASKQMVGLIANNKSLTQDQKLAQVQKVREAYVKTLQDIVALADKAAELGGGRKFSSEKKKAVKELTEMGVIKPSTFSDLKSEKQARVPSAPPTPKNPVENLIAQKRQNAKDIEQQLEALMSNPELTQEQAMAGAMKLRGQYIKVFKDIVLLAQIAKKQGSSNANIEKENKNAQEQLKQLNADIPVDKAVIDANSKKQNVSPKIDKDTRTDARDVRYEPVSDPWEDATEAEQETLKDRNKKLVKAYKKYLENLKKSDSNDTSVTISRDFVSLTNEQQQSYITAIKSAFNIKAKLYRDAVKTGQLEIAKEQGEQLIVLANTIKQLYAELDQNAEIDPAVKSSLSSYSGYATSVQNEVIAGSGAKGRVDVGLPDKFSEQLNLLENDGENVVQGFVNGIVNTLFEAKTAGEQIVEATEEGVRERGDIRSPSELFKKLGRWVAKGFGLGVVAEDLERRGREVVEQVEEGVREQVERSTTADSLAELFDLGGENLIKKIGSLIFDASQNEGFEQVLDTVGQLVGKVVRLAAAFKILQTVFKTLGVGKVVEAFTNLRELGLEVAAVSETLNQRIIDISESAEKGAANLRFITEEAGTLNKDLNAAKENYAELLGATTDNPLSGVQTELIYTAFAGAAKKKGFSNADEAALFKSVRSMIGKEKLSREEVFQEIAERMPEFPRLLASSQGVSLQQLNQMISDGQVRATDALPKVSAALIASNGLSASSPTAQASEARLDSSISSFREAVGEMFLPLQKFGYDALSKFFNWLTDKVQYLQKIISGSITTLLIYLVTWKTFGQAVQKAFLGLIQVIVSFRRAIARFLVELLLVQAAIEAWANVFKLFQNSFPEAKKDIDALTTGINKYRSALNEANNAGKDFNNNLPQNSKDLQLGEGAFGTDWLNLDTLARKPINRFLDFLNVKPPSNSASTIPTKSIIDDPYAQEQAFNKRTVEAFQVMFSGRLTTQAEKREADFLVASSEYQTQANNVILETANTFGVVDKIAEYDAQILEIQSARLRLLPGDTEGLKASLEAEKKIQSERDKQLKILTQQQQNLQLTIQAGKNRLEELEGLRQSGGITEANYNQQKSGIEAVIEDAEDGLKDLNDEMGKIPKQLSEFSRRLRNASERVSGFMEERDRISSQERTNIITEGVATGEGEQVIQLKLDRASQRDLQARIDKLQSEASKIETDLGSAALTAAQARVEEAAENSGGLTTDVINRLLEQDRDPQEKEALKGALELREIQALLFQYQEQLAQSSQQSRSQLLDFNRTIQDYFFNLTQQIKEAQLETKTLISQIFANNIRNQLRAAIKPGSDSFVNGLIDGIQGILDQAQSLIERTLGIEGNRIQFESESRSLELEMQDFIRNVGGATDALLRFSNALDRSGGSNANSQSATNNSNGDIVTALRRAIIGKESSNRYDIVNKDSGALGYGQVMPFNLYSWTTEALGKSLTKEEFLNNPDAQIKVIDHKIKQYLDRELKMTGGNLELAVRRVASTWYSGRPERYNDTSPQRYGAGQYPSINDYTADILKRFSNENNSRVLTANNNNSPVFPIPGLNLNTATITSGFGYRNIFGRKDFHEGLDFGVPGGTTVTAVRDGVVKYIKPLADQMQVGVESVNDAGQTVVEWFIHLGKKLDVQKGDRVSAGQKLGTVATTTDYARQRQVSTGDHLDYRVTVDGEWVNPKTMLSGLSNGQIRNVSANSFGNNSIVSRAIAINQQLTRDRSRSIELNEVMIAQEEEMLDIQAQQQLASQQRQFDREQREATRSQFGIRDRLTELFNQSQLPTAQLELENNLRQVETQFRDFSAELAAQKLRASDTADNLENFINAAPSAISELRARGDEKSAQFLEESVKQFTAALPAYKELIESLTQTESQLPEAQKKAIAFTRRQGELLIENEKINKRSQVQQLKTNISQQRGTNELRRQNELASERLRLEQRINEIERTEPDTEVAENLIQLERQQSLINRENINRDALDRDRQYEGQLLDLDSQINNGRGDFLIGRGFGLEGNEIKKQAAIAQENFRYQSQLAEIEKTYAGDTERIETLKQKAEELNAVNLSNIEEQFQSLGDIIRQNAQQALEQFFFDLFQNINNAGDLFKNFVKTVLQGIARMMAQRAAAQVIGLFLGGIGGGAASSVSSGTTTSLNFGGGAGAFTAKEGITVPDEVQNFKTGGRIVKKGISDRLQQMSKPIKKAFQREGKQGVLGVFTPGEEILSIKTGEAGRYQALKKELGFSPLEKIFAGNFLMGGTVDIESNLLSQLNTSSPSINLRAIGNTPKQSQVINKITNFSAEIITRDADSFRESQYQSQQDIAEALLRSR